MPHMAYEVLAPQPGTEWTLALSFDSGMSPLDC